jgi:hypothetical protein
VLVDFGERNVGDFDAGGLRELAERGEGGRGFDQFFAGLENAMAAMQRISPEPQPSTICSRLTLCSAAILSTSVSYSVRG